MKIALAQYGGRAGGILPSIMDCLSSVWWRAGGILPSVMKIALAQYGGILPSVMKIALAQYGGTTGGMT